MHNYQIIVISPKGKIVVVAFADTFQGAEDFCAIECEKHPAATIIVRSGDQVGRPLPGRWDV